MKKIFLLITIILLTFNNFAQIITTIAGDGLQGYNGDSILATNAELYFPYGVAVDFQGNIFISDDGNERIRKVDVLTGTIYTIAGNGMQGYNGNGIVANLAKLNGPLSIIVDTSDNVFFADLLNQRIRMVNKNTNIITTVAGNGYGTGLGYGGFWGDGGLATSAELYNPYSIKIDAIGNIFIVDSDNNRIRKVDHNTGIINTIVGDSTQGYNGDSILAIQAELSNPADIAIDFLGNIFISDNGNERIRKVDASTGIISTIAGTGFSGYNGDSILAIDAEIWAPIGIVVDAYGDILFVDNGNGRIRKINHVSGIITTIAGNGTQGYNGDGILATNAELNQPSNIAIDSSGTIYIADYGNNRIRKITYGTGIPNVNNTGIVSIYPNPSNGIFTLSYNSQFSTFNSQLKIYDVIGQEVYHQPINNSTQSTIDISQLSNGVYFYQLTNSKETVRGKFVKE